MKEENQDLRYGSDIDVVKVLNNKRHTINPANSIIEKDLLMDFFWNQKCSIRLLKPYMFSLSLRKLIGLTNELF